VVSKAQQFEWVKQDYPSLYEKIKKYVALGRFIPIGGTWVEMVSTTNKPKNSTFYIHFIVTYINIMSATLSSES